MKWFRRKILPPSVVKLQEDLKAIGYKSKAIVYGQETLFLTVKATRKSKEYSKLLELLETIDHLRYLFLDLEKHSNVSDWFLDGLEIQFPTLFYFGVTDCSPNFDVDQIKCPNLGRIGIEGVMHNRKRKGIEKLHGNFKSLSKLQALTILNHPITEIPKALNTLSNLRYLALYSLENVKELPYLLNLKKLISLYIAVIPLDQFPSFILELQNLRRLLFSGTLVSELPSQIDQLENLEVLYLADNPKLKSLPPSIHNLQHLWYLSVDKRMKKSEFDFNRLKEEIKLRNDAYYILDYKNDIHIEFQP